MSVSGGVMSNVALDAALDELGMLSSITNSRQEYIAELSRLAALEILQDRNVGSSNSANGMRTRASSMSTVNGRTFVLKRFKDSRLRLKPYDYVGLSLSGQKSSRRRSRTRSENESELVEHLPQCPANQHSNLDPVPYIALPIESVLASNLFKSRSMESIDARTSDGSGSTSEKESDTIASLQEVDSVSSGLHRLNVSE